MEPGESSDELLAARARGGDGDAFRALVARYRERLIAAASRGLPPALRPRVSASDVVQECVLAAHGRIADFEDRGEGSFGRWLFRILEHKVHDQVRDHLVRDRRNANRDVRMGSSPEGVPFADHVPSPGSLLGAHEQALRAREALAALPEDQQAIVRLVHEGGMTVARAAEQVGRSPDAGRKLYARGIATLASALRKMERPRP